MDKDFLTNHTLHDPPSLPHLLSPHPNLGAPLHQHHARRVGPRQNSRRLPFLQQGLRPPLLRVDRLLLVQDRLLLVLHRPRLLSTSAVVYTIACIYTAKEVTLAKVMSVVPKVWKRLMVTFIWNFIIVFAYNVVSLLFLIVGLIFVRSDTSPGDSFCRRVHCSIPGRILVCHNDMAPGHRGLRVGRLLRPKRDDQEPGSDQGQMGISVALFVVLLLCFFAIQTTFEFLVVFGNGTGTRIGVGILCLVLMSISMLFGLIIQTIIYFVCKSYHHENIDKSTLADHLGVILESMFLSSLRTFSSSNLRFDHLI
ncbi:UNVERIFIED_CONTAM: hypothetical protein Sangu_1206300 [Sesamum angustifolium]|uniref:Uncharacterized protein n=1 Tax=Sesamum angustifolium TaxID=2727405 RepID=A0AAW2NHK6_9LAMI